ncbi:MAG TPA: hypothetical protein VG755_38760 [Nannocystaceae bacterium]|nr:hypothetical protein [Nannocystaceae bacterium]
MSPFPTTVAAVDPDRAVTPEIMEAMSQTRPWVVFLGVLGIIVCVLMVGGSLWNAIQFGSVDSLFMLSGLFSMAIAALYLFPCIALLRYGGAIRGMQLGQGIDALTDALRHQKSFWRYTGVFGIVMLAIYAFVAVGMLVWSGL